MVLPKFAQRKFKLNQGIVLSKLTLTYVFVILTFPKTKTDNNKQYVVYVNDGNDGYGFALVN